MSLGNELENKKLISWMLRVMYPHDSFDDGPYDRAADAVVSAATSTPGQSLTFYTGLRELKAESFLDLSEKDATAYLKKIETLPFFGMVQGTGLVAIYNDHYVWDMLGYEGPSFDKGGYINRGFNDLDWLPEPRIEEYKEELET